MKTQENKTLELVKYRDLIIATIDYYLDNEIMPLKTENFNSTEYFKQLKAQAEDHFRKGRLTILKQWFRDFSEIQVETKDLRFNRYLIEKTGYSIDIFKDFIKRVERIIDKGKITSDNQFYDLSSFLDQQSQSEYPNKEKIDTLNQLIADYESRKLKKK